MIRASLLSLAALFLLPGPVFSKDQEGAANMKRLLDPATQAAEIARLAHADVEELRSYRLHRCPQKDGMDLLLVVSDSQFSYSSFGSNYPVEKPEELFGLNLAAGKIPGPSPATLAPFFESKSGLYDAEGRDVWRSGYYRSNGYVYDFDGDGVLEKANGTVETVKGAGDAWVFLLKSIEREPRVLLRIVYNWRPEDSSDEEDWTFRCEDSDGNGRPEICFGPKKPTSADEKHSYVFTWDTEAKAYAMVKSPAHPTHRVRLLKDVEKLDALIKEGGLGYRPLPTEKQREKLPADQKPYVFQSLKDADDVAVRAFFNGKEQKDTFYDGGPANHLPEKFWTLPAKDAALALARENQGAVHRQQWQLAVDDRGGIQPPASGWLMIHGGSALCYSYSSDDFTLRFGVDQPWLLAKEYNMQGAVGANRLIDRPGYRVRIIPLSKEDAKFLADTIFWLDRIRSLGLDGENQRIGGISSTADGFGTIEIMEDGKPLREIVSDTTWAVRSLSSRWDGAYTPEVFVNLAAWWWAGELPKKYRTEWGQTSTLEPRNLMTPYDERMKERQAGKEKEQLEAAMTEIFRRNRLDPMPSGVLDGLISCVGEERLLSQKAALEELAAALPAASAEEQEFQKLKEKRNAELYKKSPSVPDPFSSTAKKEDPAVVKAREHYEELEQKLKNDGPYLLRQPLQYSLDQLKVMQNPEALTKLSQGTGPLANWALQTLQIHHADLYTASLEEKFKNADKREKARIFDALTTFSPERAMQFIATLSADNQKLLATAIASFRREHDFGSLKASVPSLMALAENPKSDFYMRGAAIALLPDLSLDAATREKLRHLLVEELKQPQKSEYGSSMLTIAVETLSRLPDAARHLPQIESLSVEDYDGLEAGLNAIDRASVGLQDRQAHLQKFIAPKLVKNGGLMNDVFMSAWTYDLLEMAPRVAAFASESAVFEDGENARSWGGMFTSPANYRYHAAREVTALWSETDAKTRARMVIAMVLERGLPARTGKQDAKPYELALATRIKETILQLPSSERKAVIEGLINAAPNPYHEDEIVWLRALEQEK